MSVKNTIDGLTTEAILESISDGVFTIDHSWTIASFNRAAENITGISRNQAVGLRCSEVFKSNMCETQCPLAETFKTGQPVINRSGFIVDLHGRRIPVSVSTALLKDADGHVIGGAETFRDLSELEILKKNRARQRFGEMSSNSPAMQSIFDTLPAIAQSSSTILITGETGTGKEVLARAIHQESKYKNGPFIAVNCASLPDTLLESELFGYRKGAFTGADKDKKGRFALAQNGTLFLDEIGDVSAALQIKLLRVLQEREYEPLGSVQPVASNARIICATNRNLEEMVAQGVFRQDLYYRIHVISVSLPPLRERLEDLPILAQEFLQRFAALEQREIEGFDTEVFKAFFSYDWPGNIRELENTVERAVVLCSSQTITLDLLPEHFDKSCKTEQRKTNVLQETRRQAIVQVLERNHYNVQSSAVELGLHRSTLYRQIKKLGIDIP